MYVGLAKLALVVPSCRSLKEKRSVVQKVKARTRNRLSNVSVAEIGCQDVHQRIELGLAVVGADYATADACLETAIKLVAGLGLADVVDDQREVVLFGDELGSGGEWTAAKFDVEPPSPPRSKTLAERRRNWLKKGRRR